jgi:hypothetical protein
MLRVDESPQIFDQIDNLDIKYVLLTHIQLYQSLETLGVFYDGMNLLSFYLSRTYKCLLIELLDML